jgi:hypothetical protein
VREARDGLRREDVALPDRVASVYLEALRGAWGLRPLDGVASAPLLHADGTIRAAEGCDPGTRLWCEPVRGLNVPEAPAREEAAAALLRVRRHFRTFAFKHAPRVREPGQPAPAVDTSLPPGKDESAFLAGLKTAACRASPPLARDVGVTAAKHSGAGTGKGLLARAACAVPSARGPRPSRRAARGRSWRSALPRPSSRAARCCSSTTSTTGR